MDKVSVLFLLVISSSLVQSQTDSYRLPNNVRPIDYQITFTFHPNLFTGTLNTFSSSVVINLEVLSATSEIKLHSSTGTTITKISLGTTSETLTHPFNADNEILTIISPTALAAGNYTLTIDYQGTISTTDMFGIYRSSYQDESNVTKYLLTTQFQPTFARRAFPCFDEPSFKATFQLRFGGLTNPNFTVLTNTNLQAPIGGVPTYAPTPIMSSYLVAFTISEFDCTSGLPVNTVQNRICSRKEASTQRTRAVQLAPSLLAAFNIYTGIDYKDTLNKLDQVAIPDFAAGAMENWGLCTYREQYLLYDPNESTNSDEKIIASILSHEIAHQWFGNLVTMQWWSDLFLNEGMANYFEYFATHLILPEWKMDRQYVVDTVQTALRSDEGSALPLHQNVSSPTDILLMFNTISYSKGGSVFRMIEHVLGSEQFKAGLTAYLTTYKHQNTIPENLWTTLQGFVNNIYSKLPASTNLEQVMRNWVTQSGFPLLTVTLLNSEVTINQKQFLATGNTSTSQWYVPISFTTSADENKFQSTGPQIWLSPSTEQKFNLTQPAEWIILNNLQTGYYRVNYDSNTWSSIEQALAANNFSGIDELNRAGIVDDLFSFAKIDTLTYSRIFRLMEFLKQDVSYFPWIPAFNGFSYLLNRVGLRSQLGVKITEHLLSNMENLYRSTPFNNTIETDQIYTLKQTLALKWACYLGNSDCIENAKTAFTAYQTSLQKPNRNLRSTIYCTALRETTNSSHWDFLWKVYTESSLASEKVHLLSSLSCTQDTAILQNFLNLSLSDSVRSQDRIIIFQNVANNPDGSSLAREFLINNFDEILQKYQSLNNIARILQLLAGKVTSQTELDDLRTFITDKLPQEYVEEGQRALTSATENVQWLSQYENDLRTYYGLVEPNNSAYSISSKYITEIWVTLLCIIYYLNYV